MGVFIYLHSPRACHGARSTVKKKLLVNKRIKFLKDNNQRILDMREVKFSESSDLDLHTPSHIFFAAYQLDYSCLCALYFLSLSVPLFTKLSIWNTLPPYLPTSKTFSVPLTYFQDLIQKDFIKIPFKRAASSSNYHMRHTSLLQTSFSLLKGSIT